MWMMDFSDLYTWMKEFSVAHILCSCVTLGFCNSEIVLWIWIHKYPKLNFVSEPDPATQGFGSTVDVVFYTIQP
jgi:hypothetical protein